MSTDDILDAIDHALRDVSVGGDAMRWTPETPAEDARDPTGMHATTVLVGREEYPAGSRNAFEVPSPYICPPSGEHSQECMRHPCGRAVSEHREWARCRCTTTGTHGMICPVHPGQTSRRRQIASVFDVPPDLLDWTIDPASSPQGRGPRPWEAMSLEDMHRLVNDVCDAREHDVRRVQSSCKGCRSLRHRLAAIAREGRLDAEHEALLRRASQWGREHSYAEAAMARHRIPVRRDADDPLPYYRRLWNMAHMMGNTDHERHSGRTNDPVVPFVHIARARPGRVQRLLLGGASPFDGSIIARHVEHRDTEAIAVARPQALDMSIANITNPAAAMPDVDTYTAYRFYVEYAGHSSPWTEVVYLWGMGTSQAEPIVMEALARRLIGPYSGGARDLQG